MTVGKAKLLLSGLYLDEESFVLRCDTPGVHFSTAIESPTSEELGDDVPIEEITVHKELAVRESSHG